MMRPRTSLIIAAAGALLLIVAGCDESDTIAPDGSTISLNANPGQVILVGGVQDNNPIIIRATVSNSIGVPLPGQDVRFNTNSGSLSVGVTQPVSTDEFGIATTELSLATTGPTVSATSGKATASITITSANGQVTQITLNATPTVLDACPSTFELTATALDGNGDGVQGFTIIFEFAPSNPAGAFTGSFSPKQGVTDANGEVTSDLSTTDQCSTQCAGAGKDCRAILRARSEGGQTSPELEITDELQ
ncbi:MAG TPA: Ig-like domain-containing protein [Candidatus Polarisedimenticolia bacterium]|nr:Ig-like domain-containing protein [Candidatus Polarisedimenticolia bacterium]